MHGARIAFEHGRDIDKIDRLVAQFALAEIDESFDKIAQTEALGIDVDLIDRSYGRLPTRKWWAKPELGNTKVDLAMAARECKCHCARGDRHRHSPGA
jgi:hypothetical protein